MPTYIGRSEWTGTMDAGRGRLRVGSGAFECAISPRPRKDELTNPEELVGAAVAGCCALMVARTLEQEGHPSAVIRTAASVDVRETDGGPRIPRITLDIDIDDSDLDDEQIQALSRRALDAGPVSNVLSGAALEINTHRLHAG